MRIAVDVRELCGRPTGVGRYLAGLFEAWTDSAIAQRHHWTLYAHARPALPGRWDTTVKVIDGSGGTLWEQVSFANALRANRPDVLFAPGYTAPLTVPAPVVLTVHDVSFFAHPEWFSAREGARRRWLTAWSARRARAVITDSVFSESEIARHIGIERSKLTVIPLGIDPPALSEQSRRQAGLPVEAREPLVLFVGSIFERRRVDKLIEAFDAVVQTVPDARLEIVGENRTRSPRLDLDALRQSRTRPDRIQLRSYVDDATLAGLYKRAVVLVFLSEYEGFGFTPLEALAHGVAPVLLDTPIARETCGLAARYVPADAGTTTIAAAIVDLLTDRAVRAQLLGYANEVLARYDWELTAADTLRVIEEAAVGR